MNKLAHHSLIIALSFSTLSVASDTNDFQAYKAKVASESNRYINQQNTDFSSYQAEMAAAYRVFKETYRQEQNLFREQIQQQWGSFQDSDREQWVSYTHNGRVRRTVNYKEGTIEVELLAPSATPDTELQQQVQQHAKQLISATEKDAFLTDAVAQKVEQRLSALPQVIEKGSPSDEKLALSPIIPQLTEKKKVSPKLAEEILEPATLDSRNASKPGQKIMRVKLTIPKRMTNKAAPFSQQVRKVANKEGISAPLIYAIMETESYFNPFAKSHVPAYGLMQIVPVSAGKDATAYLFGKEKLLSPSYLYDSDKNIEIGGAYLHLLYYRYLKSINDPLSRLYCAIAAYNTGPGNVARAFSGNKNIRKATAIINTLSPDEVYKKLKYNLPYQETRRYIEKVTTRIGKYSSTL